MLGICVSYNRVLSITKSLYDALSQNYSREGTFIPTNLRKGCFVIFVKDNIDKNASANLIKSHYHGTSISLLQFPIDGQLGDELDRVDFVDISHGSKKLSPLPAEYTEPIKIPRSTATFYAPLCLYNFNDSDEYTDLNLAKKQEYNWLDQFIANSDLDKSWSQYHSGENRSVPIHKGINSILPLIGDKVSTLDMQHHTMKLNIKIVNVLNPGQTPVDVSDCPVYALTKEVQFRFPDQFADYVAMFGGLHIEQCLLVIHGQLIHGSGLPEVLSQCSLATIGVSVVVDVNQIKRARYCIQVVLCALYQKLCVAVKKDRLCILFSG